MIAFYNFRLIFAPPSKGSVMGIEPSRFSSKFNFHCVVLSGTAMHNKTFKADKYEAPKTFIAHSY